MAVESIWKDSLYSGAFRAGGATRQKFERSRFRFCYAFDSRLRCWENPDLTFLGYHAYDLDIFQIYIDFLFLVDQAFEGMIDSQKTKIDAADSAQSS